MDMMGDAGDEFVSNDKIHFYFYFLIGYNSCQWW